MKVLMFGWELPPFNSGGLGTACAGLTHALSEEGVQLTFVLPRKIPTAPAGYRIVFAANESNTVLDSLYKKGFYSAYSTTPEKRIDSITGTHFSHPGGSLIEEVARYQAFAHVLAKKEPFDVIHAHDWLSIPAGIEAKRVSGKPLIVHIHATEFDRTGNGDINEYVYRIERAGVHAADRVIAVSQFTKNLLVERYGVPAEKISVVHNGVTVPHPDAILSYRHVLRAHKQFGTKIVLFVGRLTLQKGPDYLIHAAKDVLEHAPNTLFIIAGSGDMEQQIIQKTAYLGISDRVLFAGFLRDGELGSMFTAADLLVMPSVSEPFGIVPLEALLHNVPVIISKQSGISEVLRHALKVDFWDRSEFANKIISVLKYPSLQQSLTKEGKKEAYRQTWTKAAHACMAIYNDISKQPALV